MGVIATLLITTAIAGVVGTGLGGLIGALLQKDSSKTVSVLLSFAAGVMLSVVCFDLVSEAIDTGVGILVVIGAIAIGVIVIYATVEIPEWDNETLMTCLETNIYFDGEKVHYMAERQTELILIR